MRVAVLDIEPIEPAEGGSRLRLKGLYHALGSGLDVTYVGAFHWRGPAFRRLRHGPNFEEITVPFSDLHCTAADMLREGMGGLTVVDASFPRFGNLSSDFCAQARSAAAEADVVIFSHPWVYAVARDAVRPDRQLIVYDAHNVEGVLRRELLGGTRIGEEIADEVEALERDLCRDADLVIACSHDDRMALVRNYGISSAKTRVCPNGVFAGDIVPASGEQRHAAKARLGLGPAPVAIFIGGAYPPNEEAAAFLRDHVAPTCPDVTIAILGDSGNALLGDANVTALPPNLRIVGRVDHAEKALWLRAADLGLNPMFSGSGTNVKMFDYLAAGLSVVATPFGRRGIDGRGVLTIAERELFATEVGVQAEIIMDDGPEVSLRKRRGRALVDRSFDWANISAELGATLVRYAAGKGRPPPFFSVTIPTLDRPDKLRRLLDLLAVQSERGFEVIVVDQSDEPTLAEDYGFELTILHTPVRGAARARNIAAAVARGSVLAFIDDDCEPCDTWLAEAKAVFSRSGAVGLEGRVVSDRMNDERWRSVHNYGCEGSGFMSCNLFARTDAFHAVNGFDTDFDEHDFRYDTDFGWRLLALGDIPFSEDAFVFHPPWPRTYSRESDEVRNRMFEGDALLLYKHPERYRGLFEREGQWVKRHQFWEPFLRGVRRYDLVLPRYIKESLIPGDNGGETE